MYYAPTSSIPQLHRLNFYKVEFIANPSVKSFNPADPKSF